MPTGENVAAYSWEASDAPWENNLRLLRLALVCVRLALACLSIAIVLAIALFVLVQPMEVPDTSSPLASNHMGVVDAGNSVGQTFIATRNNLDRMSLLLTVEEPNDYSSITFTIRDGSPDGPVLRTVKQDILSITTEDPFRWDVFRMFLVDPRWQTFSFDPIQNSRGRTLFFSVEGKYVPAPSKVKVAMMFRSGYPDGTAYVNGDKQNAHVVFRAESHGVVQEYLAVLGENATFQRQGPAASQAIYPVLAVVYASLLVAMLRAAAQALRPTS